MHGEHEIAFEIRQEIFRPPRQGLDAPSLQALGEALGQGKAQVRPAHLDALDPRALHHGRKPPANRLHLWQFGHGTYLWSRGRR